METIANLKNMKRCINRLTLAVAMTANYLLPLPGLWAGPLQTLNLASNEQIKAVAISPDGTQMAISAYALERENQNSGHFHFESDIELWDPATGRRLSNLHQRPWHQLDDTNVGSYGVGAMEFSPDGRLLAAADGHGFVLWDTTSRTETFRWSSGGVDAGLSPGWSADGKWLALPSMAQAEDDSMTNGIALIETTSGKRSAFFPVDIGYARVARISPDGKLLATAGQDCTVRVFDLGARTNIFEDNTQGDLFAAAFSPDGRHLVAGEFLLYDVVSRDGKTVIVKNGSVSARPEGEVHELDFTPDGSKAFSSSALANVRIWDTRNWTSVALASGSSGRLWPDGTKVALWRNDKPNAVEIWNLSDFAETFRGGQSPQERLAQKIGRFPPPVDTVTAARNECINNLHRIDAAKQIWATDNGKQASDTPSWSELLVYFGPNVPKCPSEGTYTVGSIGEKPQCNIAGHRLP